MNAAFAAAAEHGAEHAVPFYLEAEFWVIVGFLIFIGLVGKRIFRLLTVALDERAEKIRDRIDEAAKAAEEAQALLASYERKQRDAAEEAEAIVSSARKEAARVAIEAKEELERTLKRREAAALERIAQAEQAAIAEVRGRAVDVAVDATRRILAERLTAQQGDRLIEQAIDELPKNVRAP